MTCRLFFVAIFGLLALPTQAQYLFQHVLTPDGTATTNNELESDPDIAFGGGNWVAVWNRVDGAISGGDDPGAHGTGLNDEIFVTRSTNNGLTWSPTARLKTVFSTFGDDIEARIAGSQSGTFVTVWRSRDTLGGTIGDDTDILFSRSTDGGGSWSPAAPLATAFAGDSSEDYNPCIGSDGGNVFIAGWVNYTGSYQVKFTRSIDGGQTWSTPHVMDSVAYGGGPKVIFLGNHRWLATWQYGSAAAGVNLYYSVSDDDGATWSSQNIIHPSLATDGLSDALCHAATDGQGRVILVFESSTGSTYSGRFCISENSGATWSAPQYFSQTVKVNRPKIARNSSGRWIIAWPSLDGATKPVLMVQSTNNGVSWSLPSRLMEREDLSPRNTNVGYHSIGIANDGGDNWMIISSNTGGLGGTLGSDADILVTRAPQQVPPTALSGRMVLAFQLDGSSTVPEWQPPVQYRYVWTSNAGHCIEHGPKDDTFDVLSEQSVVLEPGQIWTVTVTPLSGNVAGPATVGRVTIHDPRSGIAVWEVYK